MIDLHTRGNLAQRDLSMVISYDGEFHFEDTNVELRQKTFSIADTAIGENVGEHTALERE